MSEHFWHMGLTVSDMERSLVFYRDVVGMEVVRGPFSGGGAGPDQLMQNPGLALDVCWLRHGNFLFQILEYTAQKGSVLDLHHNNVGSPHLSFIVADVDAEYARLQARGDVTLASPVTNMGSGRSFYAEDPDGLPVEFWQWTEPGDPVRAIGGPD
jgi:catechol 2,3-dioxygenase-like lactoylglutathione lyase family enzyme